MASKYTWVPISDLRGGRNAADAALELADNQVQQARNGDWFRQTFFRKRGGAAQPAIGSVFSAVISSLLYHVWGEEVWGVDNASTPNVGRMAGASTFSAVTLVDNVASGLGAKVRGTSYNGKFFLAYDSAVDRLHVWDPNLATPKVRRVGLGTPVAPTAADTGSGTYPATVRYYRTRARIKNGSVIVAQSEPSAVLTFTPSGSGTHARVTKPANVEEETHWMLEASADNVTFYELIEQVIASTTYDDNTTVADYADGTVSAVTGAYTVPTSWKYIIAAFNRIIGAGSHETGGKQSRVWYTTAFGAADRGDDERVPNTTNLKNWFDLDEGTGGDITGFAGVVYNAVYVFKYSQIRKFLPTGSSSPVFDTITISNTHGAIEQEAIAIGDDAQGRPAIYFLDSQMGPMVVGAMAPTPIGAGVRDLWDLVNLAASPKIGQVVYYKLKGQVWFWWATNSSNDPDVLAIYTIATGGWSVYDTGGKIRQARSAALLPRTLGATMSKDLVPYVGHSQQNNVLMRCDTTDTADNAEPFAALITTKPYAFNQGQPFRMTTPWIVAKAASGVTLTVTATIEGKDGVETRTGTVSLTPSGSETRVVRRVEGLDTAVGTLVSLSIGDASAVSNNWIVERVYIPVMPEATFP